jgi:hypothetical protein
MLSQKRWLESCGGAQSKKPYADRKLRRQWKMLAGENQVGISPIGGKLGLDSSEVL